MQFGSGHWTSAHSWFKAPLGNPERLSIFRGSAGTQPLRISWSLAMAEFSVKSFALLKLTHWSLLKQGYQMHTRVFVFSTFINHYFRSCNELPFFTVSFITPFSKFSEAKSFPSLPGIPSRPSLPSLPCKSVRKLTVNSSFYGQSGPTALFVKQNWIWHTPVMQCASLTPSIQLAPHLKMIFCMHGDNS